MSAKVTCGPCNRGEHEKCYGNPPATAVMCDCRDVGHGQHAIQDELFGPVERAAELWIALVKDITAEPCKFPCLRDDLIDWFKHHASNATNETQAGQ
jgi:hypothetical protein